MAAVLCALLSSGSSSSSSSAEEEEEEEEEEEPLLLLLSFSPVALTASTVLLYLMRNKGVTGTNAPPCLFVLFGSTVDEIITRGTKAAAAEVP